MGGCGGLGWHKGNWNEQLQVTGAGVCVYLGWGNSGLPPPHPQPSWAPCPAASPCEEVWHQFDAVASLPIPRSSVWVWPRLYLPVITRPRCLPGALNSGLGPPGAPRAPGRPSSPLPLCPAVTHWSPRPQQTAGPDAGLPVVGPTVCSGPNVSVAHSRCSANCLQMK